MLCIGNVGKWFFKNYTEIDFFSIQLNILIKNLKSIGKTSAERMAKMRKHKTNDEKDKERQKDRERKRKKIAEMSEMSEFLSLSSIS